MQGMKLAPKTGIPILIIDMNNNIYTAKWDSYSCKQRWISIGSTPFKNDIMYFNKILDERKVKGWIPIEKLSDHYKELLNLIDSVEQNIILQFDNIKKLKSSIIRELIDNDSE